MLLERRGIQNRFFVSLPFLSEVRLFAEHSDTELSRFAICRSAGPVFWPTQSAYAWTNSTAGFRAGCSQALRLAEVLGVSYCRASCWLRSWLSAGCTAAREGMSKWGILPAFADVSCSDVINPSPHLQEREVLPAVQASILFLIRITAVIILLLTLHKILFRGSFNICK